MLSFLALAAQAGLDVVGYEDDAEAVMPAAGERMRITQVTLRPQILVATGLRGVRDRRRRGRHFLVTDADAEPATAGLTRAGIDVVAVRDVLVQRLRQGVPGQLGAISAQMAAAGVNIETMYSDTTTS